MPEGDTIFRTAARLRSVIQGRRIEAATARVPTLDGDALVDRIVQAVEARGKHLLMRLDDGRTIHSHMGMTGSWHVYQEGERWRKPERQAAIVLHVGGTHVVCFSPRVLEVLDASQIRRHPQLASLGPDLLRQPLDREDILRRLRAHNQTPVGEAVMYQSIVSGIGNVYKSETLFLAGVDPFLPLARLPDEKLWRMIELARKLMRRNLSGYPRRTRFRDGGRLWVYGRSGRPCYRCGQSIRMKRQGELGRSTYWCPACQKTGNDARGADSSHLSIGHE